MECGALRRGPQHGGPSTKTLCLPATIRTPPNLFGGEQDSALRTEKNKKSPGDGRMGLGSSLALLRCHFDMPTKSACGAR